MLRRAQIDPAESNCDDDEHHPNPAARQYARFADFYPFYLSEHRNRTCRRLHFLGSSLALVCLALAVFINPWWLLLVAVRLWLRLGGPLRL